MTWDELLTGLGRLPARGTFYISLHPKIVDASGGMARPSVSRTGSAGSGEWAGNRLGLSQLRWIAARLWPSVRRHADRCTLIEPGTQLTGVHGFDGVSQLGNGFHVFSTRLVASRRAQ